MYTQEQADKDEKEFKQKAIAAENDGNQELAVLLFPSLKQWNWTNPKNKWVDFSSKVG